MKTFVLSIVFAAAGAAQGFTEAPPLIRLTRIPGMDGAAGQRYASAGAPVNMVGMASITGLAETWLLEAHGSFAGIEEVDKAFRPHAFQKNGPDPTALPQTMIAIYRPGWSYRPDQAVRMIGTARYFHVSIYRIRPGAEAELAELVRSRRISFDSVNLDRPDLAYHVISGASSGTYIFLAPLASLKTLDDGLAVQAERGSNRVAAPGEISREHQLLRVEPAISYVSDEFASADKDFWRGKQ
jgi:hypothetical protein